MSWKNVLGEQLNSSLQPVSVVIVNHNAGALLIECVCAALAQAEEVIVVDNDSSDSSMTMLATQFAAEARLVMRCTGKNLGFAAGCNLGLRLATQPLLLFLNPDCIVGEGSLRRMLEVLEHSETAGMVGGLLCNPDGSEQPGGRRLFPTPKRAFMRAFGLSRLARFFPGIFSDFLLHEEPLPEEPVGVEAISGACMLVKREAMDDVGLWDEDYFLHCEDLDWCMRFRQKKWGVLFVPDAKIIHVWGACSRSRPIFVEWHKHKGMLRFYRKFFQHQYPGVLMWLVAFGVWLRFGLLSAYYSASFVLRRLGLKRG